MLKTARTVFLLFVLTLLFVAVTAAQDQGWPRTITKPGGTVVLYQPQVDSWNNYQQVDARMAFTLTPTGGKSHVGVVTVRLKSAVNMDAHTVFLSDPQVTSVAFPGLDPTTTAQMDQLVKTFFNPAATMTISLDRLVASVKKDKIPAVSSGQERSADHLYQHEAGDPAPGEWSTHNRAHRKFQSAVRRQCQLAVVRRAGEIDLLPVRR